MKRAILARASWERAEYGRQELKACAVSGDPNERAGAVAEIRGLTEEVPFAEQGFRADQHMGAVHCSRNAEAHSPAVNFSQDQLLIAAAFVLAELRTSRNLFMRCGWKLTFSAFSLQLTRRWRAGVGLVVASFLSAAASLNAVKFDGCAVAQTGRGIRRGAGPTRRTGASRDMGAFKSSLRELARRSWRAPNLNYSQLGR